jgi:hypothetical protein
MVGINFFGKVNPVTQRIGAEGFSFADESPGTDPKHVTFLLQFLGFAQAILRRSKSLNLENTYVFVLSEVSLSKNVTCCTVLYFEKIDNI